MDKSIVEQIKSLIISEEYDEAKDALDGIMENLQFDIDDWMIESEEDEEHVETLRSTLDILQNVFAELESMDFDKDELIEQLTEAI